MSWLVGGAEDLAEVGAGCGCWDEIWGEDGFDLWEGGGDRE